MKRSFALLLALAALGFCVTTMVTSAVAAARISGLAPEALPDVMSEVSADVIGRASPELPLAVRRELAMERGLVMERAFATERG